jgi:hypothetical protein
MAPYCRVCPYVDLELVTRSSKVELIVGKNSAWEAVKIEPMRVKLKNLHC